MRFFLLIYFAGISAGYGYAQSFNAVHGSNYTGSLNVANNPASIVNSAYVWDITILGSQYQTISNAINGRNFPSNILRLNSPYSLNNGNFKRAAAANFNIRLLNARISLGKSRAIAFGLNMRGYTQAKTGTFNYNDSVKGARTFIYYNQANRDLSADMASSAWAELYGSYGATLMDRSNDRLNAAFTVKVMKSISGAYLSLDELGVQMPSLEESDAYELVSGVAAFGYSRNHDDALTASGLTAQPGQLFSKGKLGISFDAGVEYFIKSDGVDEVFEDPRPDDYLWKIGISLLDVGWNNFDYSQHSRRVSGVREGVTGNELQEKFGTINGIGSFSDSLATIVNESAVLNGKFRIINPMRLKINADRYLAGNFYVNGELSVNLSSLLAKDKLYVEESQLLTITPRWETRQIGIYMPLQYNRQGNVWVGGAVRLGPFLAGTHHLLNAFSKSNKISGGAYIALIISPFKIIGNPRNKQYECPVF